MTATGERPRCRCGLGMVETAGGGGWFCENCDSVQPQEPFRLARRKTPQDVRFEMSWLRTMNEEYQDNTTPPGVGTTNPLADETDVSSEDEGETNDHE